MDEAIAVQQTSPSRRRGALAVRPARPDHQVGRDELVVDLLPLARQLARQYADRGEPFEDLVQVASLGAVKAVDRFDVGRGVPLAAFAVPTIKGELRRHFRDTAWAVRVPRTLQERALRVFHAVDQLTMELGRSPAPAELARCVGAAVEEVLEALEAGSAYRRDSLDAPVSPDDGAAGLADLLGSYDEGFALVEAVDAVRSELIRLPWQERRAVELRFGEGLKQREIGERLGVSQMQVSRLLRRAAARVSGI